MWDVKVLSLTEKWPRPFYIVKYKCIFTTDVTTKTVANQKTGFLSKIVEHIWFLFVQEPRNAYCIVNLSVISSPSTMSKIYKIWAHFVILLHLLWWQWNYTGWPPKNGTVDFLGLCSDQQLYFSPCWIEHLFLIIIKPRSSNSVENFNFMSNFLSTVILGFAINLSSCLETLEIGQITKMTVHKKCLIK